MTWCLLLSLDKGSGTVSLAPTAPPPPHSSPPSPSCYYCRSSSWVSLLMCVELRGSRSYLSFWGSSENADAFGQRAMRIAVMNALLRCGEGAPRLTRGPPFELQIFLLLKECHEGNVNSQCAYGSSEAQVRGNACTGAFSSYVLTFRSL